jgi:hypothetical protein
MGNYHHNWLSYMPPKALALTAVSMFLDMKLVRDQIDEAPDTDEIVDGIQTIWDELCDLVGYHSASSEVFHGPGMDQELFEQFMELVE